MLGQRTIRSCVDTGRALHRARPTRRLASGRDRARGSGRRRARRRAVLPDGTPEGRPGVARLDVAVPDDGAARPHRRRAGVVVASPGQELPGSARRGRRWWTTRSKGAGRCRASPPGWRRSTDRARAAFVCSTDMPFLHPAFVRRVLRGLDGPGDGRGAAVRPRLPPAAGRRRTAPRWPGWSTSLLARGPATAGDAATSTAQVARLDDADAARRPRRRPARPGPGLGGQRQHARGVRGGTGAAARRRSWSSASARWPAAGRRGPRAGPRGDARAAAAEAVGLTLDRHVVAALNGDQMTRDPSSPGRGDTVAFLSADAGG